MDCSRPGIPVLHYLLDFAQIHMHWVDDAIQPSHPLPPLSPHALNLSQYQSFPVSQLFESDCQRWNFNFSISPPSGHSGLISFRIAWFDRFAVQDTFKNLLQHQFESISSLALSLFLWSNSHIHIWLLEIHSFDYTDSCWQSDVSAF